MFLATYSKLECLWILFYDNLFCEFFLADAHLYDIDAFRPSQRGDRFWSVRRRQDCHQFFQTPSLSIPLRYFQTALYFLEILSERRILSFSDWFKLPVRARTNASRSSFANLPEIGLRGDSIPNISSVFVCSGAKIRYFFFASKLFGENLYFYTKDIILLN